MSATLTTIETLVRYFLNETSKSQIPGDVFTYGASSVFTLMESNVIAIIDVLRNDETSAVTHTYNSITNKVTITSSLTSGDTVEIQYTYYPNYSSTEIQNYIRVAAMHLSVNNYYDFELEADGTIYPELSTRESNLLALITSILIEPNNATYRLPDMTINVPNSLPTEDLIRKAIAIFKHDTHGVFSITG